MATAHVVVIDTAFRREKIKVTPGKYMTDVRDEACAKFSLKGNYGLKNNNKTIDLSRTFRQTGLTSGAKLELVITSRTASVVSIALQLPESIASSVPGGRLVDKFSSDTTIWLILRKFESTTGANLNFTGRGVAQTEKGDSGAGRVLYEMPVLNIMGREVATFGDLQKTLAQFGLNSGSGLLRLTFRKTDQPIEEAMAEIGEYFKEEEAEKTEPAAATSSQPEPVTEAIAQLPVDTLASNEYVDMEAENISEVKPDPSPYPNPVGDAPFTAPHTPPKDMTPFEPIIGPGNRPINVYSPPSGDTPQAALQPYNDSDYEPTVNHAKLHQSRLQNNSHNKRLLSYAEEEAEKAEKAARLKNEKEVTIAVRFPDQSRVDSKFSSTDTGAALYNFVRGVIVAENEPFRLVRSSPKSTAVPDDEGQKLISGLAFAKSELVNFSWGDEASEEARKGEILKAEYRKNARKFEVKEIDLSNQPEETVPDIKGKGKEVSGGGGGKGGKGMPKWFKGLGKK